MKYYLKNSFSNHLKYFLSWQAIQNTGDRQDMAHLSQFATSVLQHEKEVLLTGTWNSPASTEKGVTSSTLRTRPREVYGFLGMGA